MNRDDVAEKHYKTRKWNACWIWKNDASEEKNSYSYFRKTFAAKKTEYSHKLYITAENYYKVYINGALVGRGPVLSQPYYKYYDVYSLDNYLNDGANCIAITVCHTGITGTDRAGILAEIQRSDGQTVLSSDKSWKFQAADAWKSDTYVAKSDKATPFQEIYDARKEPLGWKDTDFDDSCWEYARELINDWKFPFRFCGNPSSYPIVRDAMDFSSGKGYSFHAGKRYFR